MRALTLSTHRPIAILCPGAEYGPAKRWPAEHFIALGRRLLDDGYAVWLLGSPNDQAAAVPIASALAGVRDLTGRTAVTAAAPPGRPILPVARATFTNAPLVR